MTLFLGLVLENFSVSEFMRMGREGQEEDDVDRLLTKNEAKLCVAEFQRLPPEAVCVYVCCVFAHAYTCRV